MPWRSPYRPVNDVRMSSAVCAISGVWLFDRNEPLFSKKFSRFGMSSQVGRHVRVVAEEMDVIEGELHDVLNAISELARVAHCRHLLPYWH